LWLLSSLSAIQEQTADKTRKSSSKFMIRGVADLPAEKELGDLGQCIRKANDAWQTARPNVFLGFKAASASWLSQVEI
jgi:hypothetical protein